MRRREERAGLVAHVLPEHGEVDVDFAHRPLQHPNKEIAQVIHHLVHQARVVIQQIAEALEAYPIAQEAVEAAAVDADDVVPVGPALLESCPSLRLGIPPAGGGVQVLIPVALPVAARLDRVIEELRRMQRAAVVFELADDDAVALPVHAVDLGILEDLGGVVRVGAKVNGHPMCAPEGRVHALKTEVVDKPGLFVEAVCLGTGRHRQPLAPPGFPWAQPVSPIGHPVDWLKAHCSPETFPFIHLK